MMKIEHLTIEGNGVGKEMQGNRYISVFVPGTVPEDEITYTIKSKKGLKAQADLIKVVKSSPDRQAPACKFYKQCGGCNIMHIKYDAQVRFKHEIIKNILKGYNVKETTPSPELGYRHRARFRVQNGVIGYMQERSNKVIDVDECIVNHEKLNIALSLIRDIKIKQDLVFELRYDPLSDKVLAIFNMKYDEGLAELQNEEIFQNIMFNDKKMTCNKSYIEYINMGKMLQASFDVFTQVNLEQNENMMEFIKENLQLKKGETLLDLYCGVGNFSIPIAHLCKDVFGIDESEIAINDAKVNVKTNNIKNADFRYMDALKFTRNNRRVFDKIIIDPPRAGCASAIRQILKMGAKKIIYISCNPRTLASDLKEFDGYKVDFIKPFDMFPNTSHIECIAVMSKIDYEEKKEPTSE